MKCLSTCLEDDNEVISGKLPLNAACPRSNNYWSHYRLIFAPGASAQCVPVCTVFNTCNFLLLNFPPPVSVPTQRKQNKAYRRASSICPTVACVIAVSIIKQPLHGVKKMVASNAIIAALLSTGLISLAPNVLLVLFPRYASGEGESSKFLALGQALASGGLLADVFLHTIPHAGGQHDVGLWVLLGFGIFLVCDMMIRSLGHSHGHQHNQEDHPHQESAKNSTVILNLAADALHNFTDGLAIGASFALETVEDLSVGTLLASRGGLATLSILFHEIPHELGDFAILVKNGFSKNQAIMAQFGTAIAAMLGTIVGLFLHDWAGESLLFITAGGFVYL
jgi:zinc transporter ZupT